MGGQYGVVEAKEVFDLGFSLVSAVKSAKENDGKIDFKDLPLLALVVPNVGAALDKINMVPSELKDLDEADAKDLLAHAAAKLGMAVEDPALEAKVVVCLKVVLSFAEAYATFKQ